ncbi:ATP-NAD kinase family protein [Halanaerobaculum tunisiense]
MTKVGIIANPASGRDIRRLVAHGSVFDNAEKVNIVRRILLALNSLEIEEVMIMPDSFGIGQAAIDGLWGDEKDNFNLNVNILDLRINGSAQDSYQSAQMMESEGVDCIIILGGDGTSRIVVKALKETPILPLSTGTNNVFPLMIEGTCAGMAAGAFTKLGPDEQMQASAPFNLLKIYINGKQEDIALIDAVVVKKSYIGTRALWNLEALEEIFTTRGKSGDIGMASIAGALTDIQLDEETGMFIRTGEKGKLIKAPIAPGMIKEINIEDYRKIKLGERIELKSKKRILAFDGEREITVKEDDQVEIELAKAPVRFIDYRVSLELAGDKGCYF